MLKFVKGWRTIAVGLMVAVGGLLAAFADPQVIAALPPKVLGVLVASLGGLMVFLRFVTTTPPGQSGP